MKAGILRKVKHQTWVANPLMVKKSDRGWRMCVDFTDINKACPKDCYPLPKIDWKVESLSGFRLKCFLEAYKGYHQIQMAEGDKDKTAFFAGEGVFYYRKMPFGLKNAGAIYQSTSEEEILADIKETFEKFQSINMKLNPKKCSFGIKEGPFLGHLITKQGIRANPSKVKAITDVGQLKTLKDVQSLNGKIAALSRFLSKGAERSLPFFKVLKSYTDKKNIQWTQEVEAALQENEEIRRNTANAHDTNTRRDSNDVSHSLDKEHKCHFVNKKGRRAGSYLLRGYEETGDETPEDFLIEVALEDNKKETREKADIKPAKTSCKWKLFTDGAVSSDGSGERLMLIDLEEKSIPNPYASDSKQRTTKQNTKHYWSSYDYHKRWKLQV
ncbi:hypothetical protein Tco_1562703 [Tanacetum coccineum]